MNMNFTDLINSLLKLHKCLIGYQKGIFEGRYGKVDSPGTMLQLLTDNHNFSWLRRVSELIIGIEELTDSKEPADEQKLKDMMSYTKNLLTPKDGGNEFEQKYYNAIHKSPEVALAHGKTLEVLNKI